MACRRRYDADRQLAFARRVKEETGQPYYARFREKNERDRRARVAAGTEAPKRARWRDSHARNDQIRRARLAGAAVESFDPLEVYKRDGWVCGICQDGVDRTLQYPDPLSASLDHVIPLSSVPPGPHSRANTRLAHLVCNVRRGNRV